MVQLVSSLIPTRALAPVLAFALGLGALPAQADVRDRLGDLAAAEESRRGTRPEPPVAIYDSLGALLSRYDAVESPTMEPALAARFPEIRSLALSGDGSIGCLTVTPRGAAGLLLNGGRTLVIEQLPDGRLAVRDEAPLLQSQPENGACGTESVAVPAKALRADTAPRKIASGNQLRTYRLAVATTGEYYAARGGTDASVLGAIVTDLAKVNLRYGAELGINFTLVGGTTSLFYTNAGTDPYTDGAPCTMRGEAAADIPSVIDPGDFDIGHVFGAVPAGGCAGGSNVCTANKANGASTFQTDLAHPPGHEDYGGYRLIMHEMAHQFGASHTWNATTAGNCTPAQYAASSAVEPSSGTTIMSYSGTCSPQDIRPGVADAYFHSWSHDEVVTYSTLGNGNDCANVAGSGNGVPDPDAGADYTIPRNTPFRLTGSATDPDGDPLSYTWEQADLAVAQLPVNTDDGAGPLFRSLPPAADGNVRTFPQMPVVLGDMPVQIGETLPTTDRAMTFRLVARDDQATGGYEYDTAIISTNGPQFSVTAPGAGAQAAGCPVTVDWNVGSADVHAADARILLSTDGGLTFDVELDTVPIGAPPYDVTLPCATVAEARIMVEAVDNVFFDVNPASFAFEPQPPVLAGVPADESHECGAVPEAPVVTATDSCGGSLSVELNESVVPGACPGSYEIFREWTAIGACGLGAAALQTVTVQDTTPPAVVGSADDLFSLWPPNHRMRCYAQADFAPEVSDACSEPVTWRFVDCAPDQPEGTGDGNHAADCEVSDDGTSFCVRAERDGSRPEGRRYAVTIVAEDACGNASAPVVIGNVHVARSRRAP